MLLKQPGMLFAIVAVFAILILFCILIYVAGISYRNIGKALLIVVPLIIVGFLLITQTNLPILSDYQKNRIMSFLDSDNDEYSDDVIQQNNSIMAIGSGRLTGKSSKKYRSISMEKLRIKHRPDPFRLFRPGN